MKDIVRLTDLILSYGKTLYGEETPEFVALQWAEALPQADLSTFREWFHNGFWDPEVARELSNAGIHPWEVPADVAYGLCNKDLTFPKEGSSHV